MVCHFITVGIHHMFFYLYGHIKIHIYNSFYGLPFYISWRHHMFLLWTVRDLKSHNYCNIPNKVVAKYCVYYFCSSQIMNFIRRKDIQYLYIFLIRIYVSIESNKSMTYDIFIYIKES